MKLSVVSPVYNAENILEKLVEQIIKAKPEDFDELEIILVDDFSPDDSWKVIEELSKTFAEVKGIKLSRNFGQHYAITAGLDHASGDWIVVMDCDLQDQPKEIGKLFDKTKEGYDIVLAKRNNRQDTFFKKITSKIFYIMFSYLTDTKIDSSVANFGIYSKKVIDSLRLMGDSCRVFTILIQWVGFKKTYVEVTHGQRLDGKSNYNLSKLFNLAFDMIISFSEKPIKIGLKTGLIISLFSILIGIFYLVKYFVDGIDVPGYASIIILLSFMSGIIITFLGLIGSYIGKIMTQVKNRPLYIIEKSL